MWKSTALFWAQHFAGAPGPKNHDFEAKYQKVIEMGVDRKKALDALSQHNWDMDAAVKVSWLFTVFNRTAQSFNFDLHTLNQFSNDFCIVLLNFFLTDSK